MKSFDEYLENISTVDQDKRFVYSSLLSYLSTLALLGKLLERKNSGKKPFSTEFNYEQREKQRKELVASIIEVLDTKEGYKNLCQGLGQIGDTISLAEKEIKNPTFREDFEYIYGTTLALKALLD